jgi:uncharacterized damage-inducible protein DinB
MTETPQWVRDSIHHAARGTNSHADAVRAVSGLTAEAAAARTHERVHSVWENLWHAVFWQRLLLDGVQGKPVDWRDQIGKDFPSGQAPKSQEEWDKLVAEFSGGVEATQRLAMELDLAQEVPGWSGMTVGYALTIAGTHASYHIGQIIQTRIALGLWLQPEGA